MVQEKSIFTTKELTVINWFSQIKSDTEYRHWTKHPFSMLISAERDEMISIAQQRVAWCNSKHQPELLK